MRSSGLLVSLMAAYGGGLVAACGGGDSSNPPAADATPWNGPDAGRETFTACRGRAFTPAPDQDWRHTLTSVTVEAGDPNHSGQDVIAKPYSLPSLPGKFTYGTISKDLEDEDVRVFLDECDDWHELGDFATDSDGRISVPVPDRLGAGVYEVRFQVLGDGSMCRSFLWLLPTGTRITLTDIDGTMTASDSELFMQMFDGSHVPVAYPGAQDLTHAHAAKGWLVVYLTGRPYWLTQKTRDWLVDLAFERGPLHVTDSNEEAAPGESGVGAFKLAWLEGLMTAGYVIDYAYGNASTDVYAYLGSGLPPGNVWIIGENAGSMGTNGATDTWVPRVAEVEQLAAIEQPFDW